MRPLSFYPERLSPAERAFLKKRAHREWRGWKRALLGLAIVCLLLPVAVGWTWDRDGVRQPFSPERYGWGLALLGGLAGTGAALAYRRGLGRIRADLRSGHKRVEQARITRKVYMAQNDTAYFYLDSPSKLSIEVSGEDYRHFNTGDEVNIEYTEHSKIYLGYH